MKTEEAIGFVKSEFDYMDYVAFKKEVFEAGIFQQKKDDIISLLQRGEKFEEMWEELYQDCTFLESVENMHELKQKYFPLEIVEVEPFETNGVDNIGEI